MKAHFHQQTHRFRLYAGRTSALVAALLITALLSASPASAYEQVDTFGGVLSPPQGGVFPEEAQLAGVSGMAVNYTGAGGVEPGTIYAATARFGTLPSSIARYNPDGSFSEAWDAVTKATEEQREAKAEPPYERCGPEGDPVYPECSPRMATIPKRELDVDVNQATGYVYVFNQLPDAGLPTVTVYSADGSEVITRFAEQAPGTDSVLQSPAKVHSAEFGNIAVDAAGTVYIFDYTDKENFYHRLMVFKPQTPGDYEHYVYTGQSNDIGAGKLGETLYPTSPVVDANGFVYVAVTGTVQKYDPSHPGDPPICDFSFKKGGITAITVNPETGEPFFYTERGQEVHRLSAGCSEGKFTELEAFEVAPERASLFAMAFDPVRQFDPARPAGVLYAGAPGLGSGEPGTSALGYVFAPAKEIPPEVLATSVSMVTPSSARLEGKVNPSGSPTRYSFQYITDAAYQANEPSDRFAGAGEAPLGGALLEGSKAAPVGDAISGLTADTEYRYRLLATSHCAPDEPEKECMATGTEKTFRTYLAGGLGLPDGRAYELVSPAEKNGGQVFPAHPQISSCPTTECKPGEPFNHFPMQSSPDGNAVVYEGNPFSFEVGAVIENEYIARRSASGWQSTNLTPDRMQSKAAGGFRAFKADLSEGVLEQRGFPLSSLGPAEYGNLYRQPSDDPLSLSPLLAEAPPNRAPGSGLDELQLDFAGASEDFTRLFFSANDALTEDAQGGPEAKANLYEWFAGQLTLVNVAPGNATTIPGAVFGSGKLLKAGGSIPQAVITNAISADGSRAFWSSESGQVYVREDGEETREFSDHTGKFLTASVDGSKVLLSDGCLYDVEADTCEDLTGGKGGFLGIAGHSDDLSHIYLVDSAVLSGEEENDQGDKAQAGKNNLYAWNEGSLAFIATLSGQEDASAWVAAPIRRSAEASPNGGWLAFQSQAPLTGFANTGPCIYENSSKKYLQIPCSEVFLYEASTGDLRCASCTPSGAAPLGPSVLRRFAENASPTLPQPHYLSDSGRLFFDSQDSLSPADTNGRVEDVYEFEPNGVGSCKRAAGCVSLISAGRSGVDSNFLASDPSGKNVFFTSRDKLVPADKDELIDLYVAREGGGFPPPTGSGECQGEACLPAAIPPANPTPGSSSFRGEGNLSSGKGSKPRCPKGKVRRRGKCTKKPKRGAKAPRQAKRNRGGAK